MGGVGEPTSFICPTFFSSVILKAVEIEVKKHLDRTQVEESRLCDTNRVAAFSSVLFRSLSTQATANLAGGAGTHRL